MIELHQVGVTFADADEPVLSGVDLSIPEGELVLVVGRTGSGKTTLLRTLNGLVPHFSGGTLHGRVVVDGRDTRQHRPRDLADVVGYVGQDPLAGFVTDTVEDELAYGMESLGLAPDVMRKRVEETLDLLGLAEVRNRPVADLSGGQQQRVAIGSVLTTHPRVLVLDEPTSALDPLAAEEVLATLQRLVHDLGLTVVLAEHRLERVVQYADRVVLVPGGRAPVVSGTPEQVLRDAPVAPPVVELGRIAGWDPLPLSVRDARRLAGPLREQLAAVEAPERTGTGAASAAGAAGTVATTEDLVVSYGRVPALRGVTTRLGRGEVVALMGRNGAGKSTLLKTLVGMKRASSGRVLVDGLDPAGLRPSALLRHVGMVPQVPADLLYAASVGRECEQADQDARVPAGTTLALFRRLSPGVPVEQHPRDLSEGQRLTLALAIVLAVRPPLLLLDEPTRGLDYTAKHRLVEILRDLADEGHAVLLATHDVELVAEVATRVLVIADGELVADGPTADVVVSSPAFAPQVAKVLAPQRWLTPTEVAVALASTAPVTP
ncbi:ATP-binding cassette domain-containing protein [Nocardioides panacis]|uniref:ATP-binding cassette domain-containing protein n=1 Tax=Nocardioides panacis TaxID=2849501 RepID=A0A975SV42_9ACTN|nr:ATP-binding cassette domain-containing protein [Nocardioides panacis]QWZ06401.1 ATP-binding cassette domain-containing protein [Nocardioides panacis]